MYHVVCCEADNSCKLFQSPAITESREPAGSLEAASGPQLPINRFISLTMKLMYLFAQRVLSLTLTCLDNSVNLNEWFLWVISSTHTCCPSLFFMSHKGIFLTLTCPGQAHWGSPCSPGCTGCELGLGGLSGCPVLAGLCWVGGPVCAGMNMWYLMVCWERLWKIWLLHSGALRRDKRKDESESASRRLHSCCWMKTLEKYGSDICLNTQLHLLVQKYGHQNVLISTTLYTVVSL